MKKPTNVAGFAISSAGIAPSAIHLFYLGKKVGRPDYNPWFIASTLLEIFYCSPYF